MWVLVAVPPLALLVAAGAKLGDRIGAAAGLATYGLPRRAVEPLIAVETIVAAAVLAGAPHAALIAAALLTSFFVAQLAAIAMGRGGAPCGCLSGRGRLGPASLIKTAALATAFAITPEADLGPLGIGVALAVVAATAALWRDGWFTTRSPLDLAHEGPELGTVLGGGPGLVLFTAPGCGVCSRLKHVRARREHAAAWAHRGVPGAPYAVALGARGEVIAKGTVNTPRQARTLAREARMAARSAALSPPRSAALPAASPAGTSANSRRRFLASAATAGAGAGVLGTLRGLVKPGEAEAYHFCGHIYTTDSCPHPTGLPRIDRKGFPLRAKDGRAVDDLGRTIDEEGFPVDDDGTRMTDAEGRPLAPATRTRVCTATGRRYGFTPHIDGAWYRCCNGHVRKLVDCCGERRTRINGDAALTGYCYKRRKVFCVMYFQTSVPC